ncbi:hypothetical protein V8O11_23850 [Erwinia aphidicola]|uniref:Uncharacterized protein n=1 Tax=Erwinia aphidicola TaxID=68334 RepID=A0ABU8DMF9_ERWAP
MDDLFLNRVMPRTADMAARLSRYGFTECSTLRHFLLSACGEYPAPCTLQYIRGMLRTCLNRHDDGSPWFADLRVMEQQVSRAMVGG